MTKSSDTTTIQDKIDQLNKLVSWFDGEEFTLEESVEQFKQAGELVSEIEADLASLENEIEVVRKSFAK